MLTCGALLLKSSSVMLSKAEPVMSHCSGTRAGRSNSRQVHCNHDQTFADVHLDASETIARIRVRIFNAETIDLEQLTRKLYCIYSKNGFLCYKHWKIVLLLMYV